MEVLIAVGIVALGALGAVSVSVSARSMAVSTAATRFDLLLDAARTEAREFTYGATIVFTPDPFGDGFTARLYHNRPGTDQLAVAEVPAYDARVILQETEALGTPAFALAIHTSGAVGGFIGNVLSGSAGSETPCPASGNYHFVFAYGGARKDRYVPCRINLAATGPVVLAPLIPATPQQSPTANVCSRSSCTPFPPASPNSSVTCPPNYFGTAKGQCLIDKYVCSNQAAGIALGPDVDGVHEDISSGVLCPTPTPTSTPTPSPSPTSQSVFRERMFVCDPHKPPAPKGTDLGPDPDGIHEDVSDGTTCGAPPPAATPAPIGPFNFYDVTLSCDYGQITDIPLGPSYETTLSAAQDKLANAKAVNPKDYMSPALPNGMDPSTAISVQDFSEYRPVGDNQCIPL